MSTYYNEIDPFAAAWLRELISEGLIPDGWVDERDIRNVLPSDLDDYAQCHFFAGIGGWAYALRLAGWPDDRPVWTGSCPCQPFSAAGRGGGFADERHLWPAFFHLIRECGPTVVFGEQVASKAGLGWLDLVRADLEGESYAVGAADLCAAGVGAPHIRQRLFWMADADRERRGGVDALLRSPQEGWFAADQFEAAWCRASGAMADGFGPRLEGRDARALGHERNAAERSGEADGDEKCCRGGSIEVGASNGRTSAGRSNASFVGGEDRISGPAKISGTGRRASATSAEKYIGSGTIGESCLSGLVDASGEQARLPRRARQPGSTPWSDLEWLPCRDGKARPAQPGIQPLAHGVPNRVGTLRGAGNAIVGPLGAVFIRAACAPPVVNVFA